MTFLPRRAHHMLVLVSLAMALIWAPPAFAGAQPVFPGQTWEYVDPAKIGWSLPKLKAAKAYADEIGSSAVMIVQDGRVIASWGDVQRKMQIYSVRKSLLSALYGIAVAKKQVDQEDSCGAWHRRQATESHGRGGEFNELGKWRERARDIHQSGAQPKGAVAHALLDERAHLVEFFPGGLPIDLTHDGSSHRSLADESTDVERFRQCRKPFEERRERRRGTAVRPLDHRRHALPHVIVRRRVLENAAPHQHVGVDIDEAGRHHLA